MVSSNPPVPENYPGHQGTITYQGPSSTGPEQVSSAVYGHQPYVRVQLPDLGRVDGLASRWSPTHVLVTWEDENARRFNAWVPASWVERINAEDSAWRDPYHRGVR